MAKSPRNWDNRPKDNTGRSITRGYQELAYSATIALVCAAVNLQYIWFAQLTGALTVNATVTDLKDMDEVVLLFETDGTQRIVTLGTNFLSSGTITIPASKTACVRGVYDATLGKIRIYSREITA